MFTVCTAVTQLEVCRHTIDRRHPACGQPNCAAEQVLTQSLAEAKVPVPESPLVGPPFTNTGCHQCGDHWPHRLQCQACGVTDRWPWGLGLAVCIASMTGRLQLEASTSGCTHSCWTPNRPSHFGSRQQQRHQTFHHHWPNRVPQDPARVVHCRAVAPDVDTEQDDWASRLLSVTSKRRKSKQGSSTGSRNRQQAPNEGIQIQLSPSDFDGWVDNGDDDDHKEEGSGMLMSGEKRLPASVRCFDSGILPALTRYRSGCMGPINGFKQSASLSGTFQPYAKHPYRQPHS